MYPKVTAVFSPLTA